MSSQDRTEADTKNGPEMAQTVAQTNSGRKAKTHPDYWRDRLEQRAYKDREGQEREVKEWSVRLAVGKRREWFSTHTANQAAAATKARDIYLSLVSAGWDATLAKFKPAPTAKADVCTVGEFLEDVRKRSHLKPMTVRRYAVKLRKIVADLAKVGAGDKKRDRRAKYDYVNGGHRAWLARVDSQSLGLLTPEAVNGWRNAYVAKASSDPVSRKSAERSAASYLRCARALFTQDVATMLQVKLPANPFAGVKLKDPGPQRYHSAVNAEWLLAAAGTDLKAPEAKLTAQEYLALNLCLWAGLRRKEADLLTWAQIDFEAGQIHIRRTAHFEPKTEESQRDVDLPPEALDLLRAAKANSQSEFVLDGAAPNPAATYDYYRADSTWRGLNDWLRAKGVREPKAIHALRKESGSLLAAQYGIEAARAHLGHRDIRTTSAHYVSKKGRREVSLGAGQLRALEA